MPTMTYQDLPTQASVLSLDDAEREAAVDVYRFFLPGEKFGPEPDDKPEVIPARYPAFLTFERLMIEAGESGFHQIVNWLRAEFGAVRS